MPNSLEGKTALVTGASKGVGKGIALELGRAGCDVVVNYHSDAAGGQATVDELTAMGRLAFALQADVGFAAEVRAMFDQALQTVPRLDILVNNAGTQTWKALLELTKAEWDRVIGHNLKGCFLCTQRAGASHEGQWRRQHHQHRIRAATRSPSRSWHTTPHPKEGSRRSQKWRRVNWARTKFA